jgi:thiol-disulfide isomerase/thioredoxin
VEFRTGDGSVTTLEAFRGKVVLLNFWATWCPPCVWEMPSLDRLQSVLGGSRFAVVAVSIDRGGLSVVKPFFRRHRLDHLRIYFDPEQKLGSLTGGPPPRPPFLLYGLPISYLIDKDGRVLGYVPGALKWDSPAAISFLKHHIDDGRTD